MFTLVALGIFLSIYVYAANPPRDFPSGQIISVADGRGLSELSHRLAEDDVIGSPFWFRVMAIILGGERAMQAGQYYLPYPQSTFSMAWRVVHGDYRTRNVRLTILEGQTSAQISALFDERFPLFDNREFEREAEEGYLFPDTYLFPEDSTASTTLARLRKNFDERVGPLMLEIEQSGRTLEEIIIMASIIEGESGPGDERSLISGILWKRLDNKIALQVDVARETYERRGLPEKPINNPGLASIRAAIYPQSSPYLYYLHGKDGQIRYARTFDEHKENKFKYLQ